MSLGYTVKKFNFFFECLVKKHIKRRNFQTPRMSMECLKCKADVNFEVDLGKDCSTGTYGYDHVGSYFIWKIDIFYPL